MDDERRAALEAVAYGQGVDPVAAAEARRLLTAPEPEPEPGPVPEREREPVRPDPAPAPALPHRRRAFVGIVVGTAVLAAGLGVGGTVLAQQVTTAAPASAPSTAAGQDIARLLRSTATNADLLPTTMHADVDRTTSRLVFENYPDVPPVPWRVWIALDRAGTSVCFVSTPDGYASDVTCASRAQALTGTVSFVTEDGGEGVAVHDVHGVVRVDLIGAN